MFHAISSNVDVGIRPTGSTDDHVSSIYKAHGGGAVGVDANRRVDIYVGTDTPRFYLVGWFTSDEAYFFTNKPDVEPAVAGEWVDVDVSALVQPGDDCLGVIVESNGSSGNYLGGARMKGSTDDRHGGLNRHGWAICGVDANKVCQLYKLGNPAYVGLCGYIKKNVVFYANGIPTNPDAANKWRDLAPLPAGAVGGVYDYLEGPPIIFGMRPNGSVSAVTASAHNERWLVSGCDEAGIVEALVQNTHYAALYLLGYFIPDSPTITSLDPDPSAWPDYPVLRAYKITSGAIPPTYGTRLIRGKVIGQGDAGAYRGHPIVRAVDVGSGALDTHPGTEMARIYLIGEGDAEGYKGQEIVQLFTVE